MALFTTSYQNFISFSLVIGYIVMTESKSVWSMLPKLLSLKVSLLRFRKDFSWNFRTVVHRPAGEF